MLTALQTGNRVVGAKQVGRALRDGSATLVFLAADADPRVTEPLLERCTQLGVPTEGAVTMKQLGAACSIAVGAAVAALLK